MDLGYIAPRHSLAMLGALSRPTQQGTPRHIYAGTVPPHVVAKRRARNKQARVSRRLNRCH